MSANYIENFVLRPGTSDLNGNKRTALTPKGRATLRASALAHRPWLASTGPTTVDGKRRSRLNALKHGEYAFATLPSDLREFIVALRLAKQGRGALPLTDRPLQAYIRSVEHFGSPRLLARLGRLMACYYSLYTLDHLRLSTSELMRTHALTFKLKFGYDAPWTYPWPLNSRQAVATEMIVRLAQRRLKESVRVLILDPSEDTWTALLMADDGTYYDVVAARTPDGRWSLCSMLSRTLCEQRQ